MQVRAASPQLVGRERELRVLEATLHAAGAGVGMVLVQGDAGIGKTRLLEEFADRAGRTGALVLVGTCLEMGGEALPYGPIVHALRSQLPGRGRVAALLLSPQRRELAALLPELDTNAPDLSGAGRTRLFQQFASLLVDLADRAPVALVLDDLQWADVSTRDLIRFLLQAMDGQSVLLVGAARTDEPRSGRIAWLSAFARNRRSQVIDLLPLRRFEMGRQLAGILGEEPPISLLDRIFTRSEGNPLFAEELLAAGGGAGVPSSVRELMLARVLHLPREGRTVLRLASVGGVVVDPLVIASVSEWSEERVLETLADAGEAGLLVPRGDHQAFRHPLLRDAIYHSLLPGQRRRYHRRFAEVLASREDRDVGRMAMVAHHWSAAGAHDRALATSVDAARGARRLLAHPEAHRHYDAALALWPKVDDPEQVAGLDRLSLLEQAADAAYLGGMPGRAAELLKEAIAHLGLPKDAHRRGRGLARLGDALADMAGPLRDAFTVLREAEMLLPDDDPEKARVVATLSIYTVQVQGAIAEGEQLARRAIDLAGRAEAPGAAVLAHLSLAALAAGREDLETALALQRRAREIGDPRSVLVALNNEAAVLLGAGRFTEAADAAKRGVRFAADNGLAVHRGSWLSANLAESLIELGRWDHAERLIHDQTIADLPPRARLYIGTLEVWLDVARGSARARERADDALQEAERHEQAQFVIPLLWLLTELSLRSNELADARRFSRRAFALARAGQLSELPAAAWMALRAEADIRESGQEVEDDPDLRNAVESARSSALPAVAAFAGLGAGELGRIEQKPDAAVWRDAAQQWEAMRAPYRAAYARLREAEAALINGRRGDAELSLRAAHAIAVALGAVPLTREVEALASRGRLTLAVSTVMPPEAADPLARFDLSAREMEVLRLLATGKTNREIGELLFISPKTASVHVSNILRKLDVGSRVQAAGMAHRFGLVDTDRPTQ